MAKIPETELNGKKKRGGFLNLNGYGKMIAAIVSTLVIATAIWRGGTFCQGLVDGIKKGQEKNAQQDSCIARLETTNDKILYLLTVQQIKDSLQSPRTLKQAKTMADSQAIYNAQHPGQ